jgi:amino acid adenylation domain-containing protein
MQVTRLDDYLWRSAQRDPDRTALVMGAERISYGQLEESTNRLAWLLREHGCGRGDRVCLLAPKSPATIAGMLAVLKAGGAYVSIDSASPAPRIARIFASADPTLVLADRSVSRIIDELLASGGLAADVRIGSVSGPIAGERFETAFTMADCSGQSSQPLPRRGISDDPAHLLFTSGSTGDPKGVVITHSNVIAFIEWAVRYFGIRATDRISGHPPLHFDLSTFDIYGTFAAGAELHLVSAELNVNPQALSGLIRNAELTQWFSVPSVLTYMAKFDAIAQDDFPSLERLLWCGEVLPTPVLIHWMRRLPHVRFTNLYGPTEATIASSFYTVPRCPDDETQPIPIGTACAGEELIVLDKQLMPVPRGEIGDLYIGGVGLSPGYWRDEAKTAAAFVSDPRHPHARIYRTGDLARLGDDGLVEFLGRADSQIKSRGYRIELGEIEAAMNAIDGIRECAVVGVDTGGFEGTAICCAYATMDGVELKPVVLRRRLSKVLPAYMLPARWMQCDGLPKNVNGKIDRKQLRERFAEHTATASAARPLARPAVQ